MYLVRCLSKVKCDICDKDTDCISYINVDIDNVEDDSLDTSSVFATSYFCNHCGFGYAASANSYAIGASNTGTYPANRYKYADKLAELIESDHWVGPDIDECLEKWNAIDCSIKKSSKQLL